MNNINSHPDKIYYVQINRGGGSERHKLQAGYKDRSDVSYIMDISRLSKRDLKNFIHDINRVGSMDYETATDFIYKGLERKYGVRRVIEKDLIVYQKNQTRGNCPAASVKGVMKFLCNIEFGRKRGSEIFYDMVSKMKAWALVDTFIELEDAHTLEQKDIKNTIRDIIRLYVPKIENRVFLKNDKIFFNELKSKVHVLKKNKKNIKTCKIIESILKKYE